MFLHLLPVLMAISRGELVQKVISILKWLASSLSKVLNELTIPFQKYLDHNPFHLLKDDSGYKIMISEGGVKTCGESVQENSSVS